MFMVMVLDKVLRFLEDLISGNLPFALLIIGGVFLTFKGKFFQFTGLFKSFGLVKKAVLKKEENTSGITSFQAACTALSATVGTGNIAGVAGAVSLGGAGAVFWMWVSAFFGMAVKYGEIALSVKYRDNGKLKGGPMYYIKTALPNKLKSFGTIFSICALPAVICGGNITQTNAAITSFASSSSLKLISGIIFAIFTALSLGGGIKRIGKITEKLIPLMSLVYIILAIIVIFFNFEMLPKAFFMIIKGAFSPKAVTGGMVGSLTRAAIVGASRGVFSNEAGLGTSAMAHSVAYDADSKIQGYFGIFEVFIDTVVICTLTALTILCSGVKINYGDDASSFLVKEALFSVFGSFSSVLIPFMMCVFGFSSVIGWAVYGEICADFLKRPIIKKCFLITYPLFCIVGAVCDTALVWRLAAFFNGIMLIINLPAVVFLNDEFLIKKVKKSDKSKNRKIKRTNQ